MSKYFINEFSDGKNKRKLPLIDPLKNYYKENQKKNFYKKMTQRNPNVLTSNKYTIPMHALAGEDFISHIPSINNVQKNIVKYMGDQERIKK